MQIEKLPAKEQVVKTVVKSGNGGAVWVPKHWLGEEVVVILPDRPKIGLKEKAMHLLEPYLKDIISVSLYGSYARNEQTKDSDIDILAITKNKDLKLNFKDQKIDVMAIPLEKLKKAIEKHPAAYYQIIMEAEPIINSYVLDELKNIKIDKKMFVGYLKETREHITSNKELLELDKLDGIYLKSTSMLYSTILRLRGVFIIKCILEKAQFSNKNFKKWIVHNGLSGNEFEDAYKIYRLIRDNKNAKGLKINIMAAEKALNMLEKELRLLEAKIHDK